jgi:hypothetical protein
LGTRIIILPVVSGKSTTGLIEKIARLQEKHALLRQTLYGATTL